MIKPKELRFGNFLFDDEGSLVKVTGFAPHSHSTRCDEEEGCIILFDIYSRDGKIKQGYENESDNMNPIPLTPEWLERFGFIDPAKNGLAYCKEINLADELCWYVQDGLGQLRYQTIGSGFTRARMHIIQVHQIQNFFYWHTGQELNLKNNN